REFADEMVRVGQDSARIIGELERLTAAVNAIVTRADSIEQLARATRLLALNARIETERAGMAGRTFGVVADEVKRLAASSAQRSDQIGAEVNVCHVSLRETNRTAGSLSTHDVDSTMTSRYRLVDAVGKLDDVNRTLEETLGKVENSVALAVQA